MVYQSKLRSSLTRLCVRFRKKSLNVRFKFILVRSVCRILAFSCGTQIAILLIHLSFRALLLKATELHQWEHATVTI